MKKKLTIIDADSLNYIVSWNYRADHQMHERNHTIFIAQIHEFVEDILNKTEAEVYLGFFEQAGKPSFRRDLYPAYKASRVKKPEVLYWSPITNKALRERYKFIEITNNIETDDAVSIAYHKFKDAYNITMAYVDKDLKQLGEHTAYNYKTKETTLVTAEEASISLYTQVLTGDSTDNIPGCPQYGPVAAAADIQQIINTAEPTMPLDMVLYNFSVDKYLEQFTTVLPQREYNALCKTAVEAYKLKHNLQRIPADIKKLVEAQVLAANPQIFAVNYNDIYAYYHKMYTLVRMLTAETPNFQINETDMVAYTATQPRALTPEILLDL
jgi:5'-3' exonuclease